MIHQGGGGINQQEVGGNASGATGGAAGTITGTQLSQAQDGKAGGNLLTFWKMAQTVGRTTTTNNVNSNRLLVVDIVQLVLCNWNRTGGTASQITL